jgi:hypothetical protein
VAVCPVGLMETSKGIPWNLMFFVKDALLPSPKARARHDILKENFIKGDLVFVTRNEDDLKLVVLLLDFVVFLEKRRNER